MNLTKHDRVCSFLVFLSVIGVLWAARILVLTYFADHWFGTLGVTTILLGGITYLSWYDKLGWYGRIFKGIIKNKLVRKLRKLAIIQSLIFCILAVIVITSIHLGNSQVIVSGFESKGQTAPDFKDQTKTIETLKEITPTQWVMSLLLLPMLFVVKFDLMAGAISYINSNLDNLPLHIFEIILVEELEIFGLMIWHRRMAKNDNILGKEQSL